MVRRASKKRRLALAREEILELMLQNIHLSDDIIHRATATNKALRDFRGDRLLSRIRVNLAARKIARAIPMLAMRRAGAITGMPAAELEWDLSLMGPRGGYGYTLLGLAIDEQNLWLLRWAVEVKHCWVHLPHCLNAARSVEVTALAIFEFVYDHLHYSGKYHDPGCVAHLCREIAQEGRLDMLQYVVRHPTKPLVDGFRNSPSNGMFADYWCAYLAEAEAQKHGHADVVAFCQAPSF